MTENELLQAVLDAVPQPLQDDEITVPMLIKQGIPSMVARGMIAKWLKDGTLTARVAINPVTGKRINAYKRI